MIIQKAHIKLQVVEETPRIIIAIWISPIESADKKTQAVSIERQQCTVDKNDTIVSVGTVDKEEKLVIAMLVKGLLSFAVEDY